MPRTVTLQVDDDKQLHKALLYIRRYSAIDPARVEIVEPLTQEEADALRDRFIAGHRNVAGWFDQLNIQIKEPEEEG